MKNKAKILVIEDETAVAMMMVFLLTRAGCEAQTAWNVERAMELAQSEDFNLVTLDIDLPGAGGFEIYRRLQQLPRWQNPPVIFVSERAHPEDRQRAFDLGAADFIEKPFGASDFTSRIFACLEPRPCVSNVPDQNPSISSQRFCSASHGNQ